MQVLNAYLLLRIENYVVNQSDFVQTARQLQSKRHFRRFFQPVRVFYYQLPRHNQFVQAVRFESLDELFQQLFTAFRSPFLTRYFGFAQRSVNYCRFLSFLQA